MRMIRDPKTGSTIELPAEPTGGSAGSAWGRRSMIARYGSTDTTPPDNAAWVTSKVVPAIVSVPERLAAPVLAATPNDVVPGPVALAPPVMLIHAALLAAVHAQPAPAVTVLLPVPAAAVNVWLLGEIEYAQAPACVTLNVVPAIVSVPDRLVVAVLVATLNAVVPGPVPPAPAVMLIHAALLAAVHAQAAPAVTVLPPVPPVAAKESLVGEME